MEVANRFDRLAALARNKWIQKALFISLLALIVLNRVIILFSANQMVDSDQPFMWLGTRDYAAGNFYEPRFYGQDYNTFFEALVAAPLYKAGVPINFTVPIATHLIFLFPLFFSLVFLFRKGRCLQAIAGASILLYFSTAFDILSSLPRGFVGGIFFCSFFLPSIFRPNNVKLIAINTVLIAIGYYITPNLLLAAGPYLFYLWLHHIKNFKFYLLAPLFLTALGIFYFVFDYFYKLHPEYVVYNLVNDFSLQYFLQNITQLDQCFAHVSFFVEDNSLPLLLGFLVMTVITFKAGKNLFYTWLCFLVVLLLSFFAGKTRDGSFWPYYSYSRMYLALPLIFIVFIGSIPFRKTVAVFIFVALALVFESYKLFKVKDVIAFHTNHLHAKGVRITSVETIKDAVSTYKKFCSNNDVHELKLSTIFWLSPYLTYGAQVLDPEFPNTEETWADRRYWVRVQHEDSVYKRFIIISINYEFDKLTAGKYAFDVKKLDDWGVFLIENNRLRNKEFMDILRDIED